MNKVIELLKRLAACKNVTQTFHSDGSSAPSKTKVGRLIKIGYSKTGLRLYVQVGDKIAKVNWRMSRATADIIIGEIYRQRVNAGFYRQSVSA